MNLNEFIEKNGIAIVAKANLQEKSFDIIKKDLELESYDLFEQLILSGSVDNLIESIEGQILPRIWTQGNTRCVVCQPAPNQIMALFYNSSLNVKDEYYHAKEIDTLLKSLQER
jgi:hypothetical protein